MGRREYDQSCSLAGALDRIGERWSLLIVRELSLGPQRFSDLVVNVGGAPTDVLTKRLRDLERHEIVRRRPLDPPAGGSAYELTAIGRELEPTMLELGRWGLNFERAEEIADLPPTFLANAVRLIVRAPADLRMTVVLRSGGQSYVLRIADGWIAASRGDADDADLILSGEPAAILTALVIGGDAEAGIDIEAHGATFARLRETIVLPERLREETLALAARAVAA